MAQNREIDEARFFGAPLATGVVVASSVRGVNGNEPEGEYALSSGGHTFTAPASVTVGEDTYSCTGHTLETWDGSTWGTPVAHDGELSCALADTSTKVRLTWQWSHTAGPGYDEAFSDYVTDGLVVHLDGIRNAGSQATHDDSAVNWTDLSTKGGAAWPLNNSDATASGSAVTTSGWKNDGYYFNGATNDFCNIYYNRTTNPRLLSFKVCNASNGGKKVDLSGNVWEGILAPKKFHLNCKKCRAGEIYGCCPCA